MGFVLDEEEALSLLEDDSAPYSDVVAPFLNGDDIVNSPDQRPSRWVIDFGTRPLEECTAYPRALRIIEERVRPAREHDPAQMKTWWLFWRPRPDLRRELARMTRYAAASRVGKRLLLTWCEPDWRPSDACVVFVTHDDYTFGVVQSAVHDVWARAQGSTLKGDLRYTPSTSFDTYPFPWHEPSQEHQDAVEDAARRIVAERRAACDQSGRGLTWVYNKMDDGAYTGLRKAHHDLDRAVLACYGWPASLLEDKAKLLASLYDLNAALARDPGYAPFRHRPPRDG